jgi:hypothetical protein
MTATEHDQPAPGQGEPERMCWLDTWPFLASLVLGAIAVAIGAMAGVV